jgi:hypothetical protein
MLTLLISFVNVYCVGFETLTAVVMKISIFWDITLYSPLKANQCCASIVRVEEKAQK